MPPKKTNPTHIKLGAKFHHVDCGYNMEIIDIKTKKGLTTAIVKYLDRDKPDFNATVEYLLHMFNFGRFAFN